MNLITGISNKQLLVNWYGLAKASGQKSPGRIDKNKKDQICRLAILQIDEEAL